MANDTIRSGSLPPYRRLSPPARSRSPVSVRHYGPGGRENGGGIGRFIGYVVDAAQGRGAVHLVTDTRGPGWSYVTSPWRLAAALAVMGRDRLAAPARLHHIHLAGRGSTARKLLLAAAAWRLGCRHILHLHDYDYAADYARRGPSAQAAIRRMFQRADAVIVLGKHDRALAIETLGVDPARAVIFHNSVPDPGPRQARPGAVPLILFLGRLGDRKGIPELLTALSSPDLRAREWCAVLAGDGPVDAIRRKVADLNLADRITLPGWLGVAETAALCQRASILVLPSHAEGLAMAVLEGLAHGLAVVTTRVGAHEEALTHEASGLFVPVGDPTALAAALERLLADPDLREALSRQGRDVFRARFSITAYMSRLDALYETVAARRTGGAIDPQRTA